MDISVAAVRSGVKPLDDASDYPLDMSPMTQCATCLDFLAPFVGALAIFDTDADRLDDEHAEATKQKHHILPSSPNQSSLFPMDLLPTPSSTTIRTAGG